jgi:hypothetical protein
MTRSNLDQTSATGSNHYPLVCSSPPPSIAASPAAEIDAQVPEKLDIRSSASLPNSPEKGSVEVFIPLSSSSKPISAADIRAFIDRHNKNPGPFDWTKSADQTLASMKRFCQKAQQTLCSEL